MENNICHFEIPVDDLEAARAFYGSLLAWSIEPAPKPGDAYLFVRTSEQPGAVAGGLLKRSDTQPGVTLYFNVVDLDEQQKKIVALGGTVLVPRTAIAKLGWTLLARDPSGNTFGLFQEDPTAA